MSVQMPECPECGRQLLPSDFDGYASEGAICRYCSGEYLGSENGDGGDRDE